MKPVKPWDCVLANRRAYLRRASVAIRTRRSGAWYNNLLTMEQWNGPTEVGEPSQDPAPGGPLELR